MEYSIQPLQPLQPLSLQSANLTLGFAGILLAGSQGLTVGKRYYVSVVDSIVRILGTRRGARVMRPAFGSDLYLLRDRPFDAAWRVMATRYIFEAISQFEPRVAFKKLTFNVDASTGKLSFIILLDPRGV